MCCLGTTERTQLFKSAMPTYGHSKPFVKGKPTNVLVVSVFCLYFGKIWRQHTLQLRPGISSPKHGWGISRRTYLQLLHATSKGYRSAFPEDFHSPFGRPGHMFSLSPNLNKYFKGYNIPKSSATPMPSIIPHEQINVMNLPSSAPRHSLF